MHRGELPEPPHPSKTPLSVVILLADGARPDTLDAAVRSGALPALARLRDEGGMHTITSCFPSVTGPAYAPFLMGRFPGPIGLPGLRWFDRARDVCTFPDYTRSYVGYQMASVDRDIAADAPTIFELCDWQHRRAQRHWPRTCRCAIASDRSPRRPRSARRERTSPATSRDGLQIDRDVATQVTRRIRDGKPEFVFAALTGVDKVSHARGHDSPMIMDALRIVDDTAAQIRADAERAGRWEDMSLWVVSDHGHSRVTQHEDLAGIVAAEGHRTCRIRGCSRVAPDVAVMVSGNAMAHLYLDVRSPRAPGDRARSAVDARCSTRCSRARRWTRARAGRERRCDPCAARAGARRRAGRRSHTTIGATAAIRSASAAISTACRRTRRTTRRSRRTIRTASCRSSISRIAPRSGEIILSAARDWDFRARYEPIPHVSSHGALHREHMLVPLLVNRPIGGRPRRTVDVMPSALAALGKTIPPGLDGASFL